MPHAGGSKYRGKGKPRRYKGAEPHDDNNLQALRPSSMKLIEQFAEFLGGKASVETTGSFHSIIIEMPVARERA